MKNSKILSIVNLLLFVGVILTNALANILPINNYNTGELSDLIPNLFVPAGITFSIWGVIYILLTILVFSNIVSSLKDPSIKLVPFNILLGINFILNILWILSWHYRLVPLSLIIMIGLFYTLFKFDRHLKSMNKSNLKKIFFITNSVYWGWISIATIANFTALFVTLGWDGSPLNEVVWTIILIIIGLIITTLMLLQYNNIPFALVVIWAYLGIFIKRSSTEPSFQSIIVVSIFSIIILVITSIYTLLRRKKIT